MRTLRVPSIYSYQHILEVVSDKFTSNKNIYIHLQVKQIYQSTARLSLEWNITKIFTIWRKFLSINFIKKLSIKYAYCLFCFVLAISLVKKGFMGSIWTSILQGCFTVSRAFTWLPQCYVSNPVEYRLNWWLPKHNKIYQSTHMCTYSSIMASPWPRVILLNKGIINCYLSIEWWNGFNHKILVGNESWNNMKQYGVKSGHSSA